MLCFSFLLGSCKKELEEVVVAPVISWEAHKEFIHNRRFINNIYGSDEDLFVFGLNLFSRVSLTTGEEKVEHAYHYYSGLAECKLPLNRKVFVGAYGKTLRFKSNLYPVLMDSYLTINMEEIDPHFSSFEPIRSNSVEAIGLTDNNVALVPYYAYDAEKVSI